jgi:hypothetical protein
VLTAIDDEPIPADSGSGLGSDHFACFVLDRDEISTAVSTCCLSKQFNELDDDTCRLPLSPTSNIAAAKPEVVIWLDLLNVEIKFREPYIQFQGRQAG